MKAFNEIFFPTVTITICSSTEQTVLGLHDAQQERTSHSRRDPRSRELCIGEQFLTNFCTQQEMQVCIDCQIVINDIVNIVKGKYKGGLKIKSGKYLWFYLFGRNYELLLITLFYTLPKQLSRRYRKKISYKSSFGKHVSYCHCLKN